MDILEATTLEVHCPSCGQAYDVAVANVMRSQEILNEGCAARGESECPPMYLASMLNHADLQELRDVWQRLSREAESGGGRLVIKATDRDGERD